MTIAKFNSATTWLNSKTEQQAYAAFIKERFRTDERRLDHNEYYSELIKTLHKLSTSGYPMEWKLSKANIKHLMTFVRLVQRKDLIGPTGGFIGAHNGYYAAHLGVDTLTVSKILGELKKAGLILEHKGTKNHRRWSKKNKDGSMDGRGYSLLPLLIKMDQYKRCAESNHQLRIAIRQTKIDIKSTMRDIETKGSYANRSLNRNIQDLRNEILNICSRTNIRELSVILSRALLIERDLETLIVSSIQNEEIECQCSKNSEQHQIRNQPNSIKTCSAVQGEKGNDATAIDHRSDQIEGRVESDFGISASGITTKEAKTISTHSGEYVPENYQEAKMLESAAKLAGKLEINASLLDRSLTYLGTNSTFWILYLVNDKFMKGEIRSSVGAYFNGMVSRGRNGALDLNKSIWGLRQTSRIATL